jgi:DNA-binding NarL/FixJ family response regulator
LLKSIPLEELVTAIRTVHSGGAIMNPDVAAKVFAHFSRSGAEAAPTAPPPSAPPAAAGPEPSLNRSEQGIIALIAAGLSNKEITARLNLSEGTVRNYISSILQKLGLRDRTQIAIWAVGHGHGPGSTQP